MEVLTHYRAVMQVGGQFCLKNKTKPKAFLLGGELNLSCRQDVTSEANGPARELLGGVGDGKHYMKSENTEDRLTEGMPAQGHSQEASLFLLSRSSTVNLSGTVICTKFIILFEMPA